MTGAIVLVYLYLLLFSKPKKRCSRPALTRDPTVLQRLLSRESERISAQTLCRQKLESMPKICTALSRPMGLSLLVFVQLFSKIARSNARQTSVKTEFNAK